ncbi:Rieske domain-containing protein [Tachysurus vachellii]|uniref:Rieske domain-containing protein n=1 Tax=Tachysurus vachellii TaxID=175792 RepID=UPI00296B3D24|nr:Rieske domain-containing protein [Tachysurus vachellii]
MSEAERVICRVDRANRSAPGSSDNSCVRPAENIHRPHIQQAVNQLQTFKDLINRLSATMSEKEPADSGKSCLVGKKENLIEAKRTSVTVGDRVVVVIYHQGVFYAMDQHCYHAGGSLLNGDIEEIDNRLCIVCPKHKYKISMAEGEGLYISNPKDKDQPPCWKSKGIKQRVHKVTEVDGDIYVTLSETPGWIDSDYYQSEQGRMDLKLAKELDIAKSKSS